MMTHQIWNRHPGVRGSSELTFGERAADHMKKAFATWTALLGILVGMLAWIVTGGFGADAKPFILLNLCLSCIAALQCFVLLIAARRSDQIAAELAQHDLDTDIATKQLLEALAVNFAALSKRHDELTSQHAEQTAQLAEQAAETREIKALLLAAQAPVKPASGTAPPPRGGTK